MSYVLVLIFGIWVGMLVQGAIDFRHVKKHVKEIQVELENLDELIKRPT